MTIKITNQRPAEIYKPLDILPEIDISLPADEYLDEQFNYLKETMVTPLFQPLSGQTSVLMEDIKDPAKPIAFDEDAITNGIWHMWTHDVVDPNLDEQLTDVYYQSLRYSQNNDWRIEAQQSVESLSQLKLPLPSTGVNGQMVTYTAKLDIIPTAKELLADPSDTTIVREWFAHLSGFLHNRTTNTVLFTVQSANVWDTLKQQISAMRQALNHQGNLTPDTNKLLSDFNSINLTGELSTGVFLPEQQSDESYSFNRILMNIFAIFERTNPELLTVQPINVKELILPENIIVLNLEEYAHATDREIIDDWNAIDQAFTIQKRLNITSIKKLMTAKSVNAATAPSTTYRRTETSSAARRNQRPFTDKPITSKHMLKLMENVIKRTTTRKQTENTYKTTKNTFMRPNRREPNNINLQGKTHTVSYRPDIHIYLDTSGSIDEQQYRDAVGSLIKLTKRIDANLYLSSFSHEISQSSLIKTKNKSTAQIYKDFLKVPKVTGGTEFENVWNKIDQLDQMNQRAGKSYQLNFIITDFGYGLRRERQFTREQPSNKYTYYVPISSDPGNWKHIVHMAKRFSKQMASAGAKGIRKHMLM